MVDNIEQILPLLKFEKENDFYFLQICQRSKDNPKIRGDRNIKSYYIKSKSYIPEFYNEITGLCNFFNARALINLNTRNLIDMGILLGAVVSEYMINNQYSKISRAYEATCGNEWNTNAISKKWLIDIDTEDHIVQKHIIEKIVSYSAQVTVYASIPSKSGLHLITSGFDPSILIPFKEVEIKKQPITNLYIP